MTANNNSFFGASSGSGVTGSYNTFFGAGSGGSVGGGNFNTLIGGLSRFVPGSSANRALLIGFEAQLMGTDLTNATAIGAYSLVTQSNSIVLGGVPGGQVGPDGTRVGVGTTAPKARLEVANGDLLIGTAGQGPILKSATGNTCVKLTVTDDPSLVGSVVPCP